MLPKSRYAVFIASGNDLSIPSRMLPMVEMAVLERQGKGLSIPSRMLRYLIRILGLLIG